MFDEKPITPPIGERAQAAAGAATPGGVAGGMRTSGTD